MARLLLIGLELGDGALIQRWCDQGHLPAIAALRARGHWAPLATTAETLHVSAWPSLYTGTAPGEHGVYFTFQPRPGEQGHTRFHPGLYGRPTFWQLAAAAGRKVAVLDAPYTHAEPGFTGRQVIDWGSWAQYLKTQSTPADLVTRLTSAVGPYPLGLEAHDIGLRAIPATEMEQRILKALPAKAAAIEWLMAEAPWDLLVTVFGETHPAAHYCWSATDADQAMLLRIYRALDAAIGRVLAAAGPETAVLLVSGDAIGPNHAGWHLLPEALQRLGYLAKPGSAPAASAGDAPAPAARRSLDPVKLLRDLLPKDFRKSLARMLPTALRDRLAKRVDTADIDWSRTRAFCLPTDLEGLIRVNLKGREPQGIVEPGAAYEALLDELTADLLALRDPADGRPLVERVVRTDRDLPGIRRQHLPDLIVLWSRAKPITALASPRIGRVALPSPDGRPGTHAAPGFVLAAGPAPAPPETEADILDLAPTILGFLGVTPPGHMTGRVWRETSPSEQQQGAERA